MEQRGFILDDMTDQIPQWMLDHMEDDRRFQHKMVEEVIPSLATKADLKKLATEESVRELVHLQRNFLTAADILSRGGKWTYRAVLVLASLLTALAIITGTWKAFAAWALSKVV